MNIYLGKVRENEIKYCILNSFISLCEGNFFKFVPNFQNGSNIFLNQQDWKFRRVWLLLQSEVSFWMGESA